MTRVRNNLYITRYCLPTRRRKQGRNKSIEHVLCLFVTYFHHSIAPHLLHIVADLNTPPGLNVLVVEVYPVCMDVDCGVLKEMYDIIRESGGNCTVKKAELNESSSNYITPVSIDSVPDVVLVIVAKSQSRPKVFEDPSSEFVFTKLQEDLEREIILKRRQTNQRIADAPNQPQGTGVNTLSYSFDL